MGLFSLVFLAEGQRNLDKARGIRHKRTAIDSFSAHFTRYTKRLVG